MMQAETIVKPERPWALRLLPPFPAVAQRVIALVANESTNVRQLSAVVRMDPTFTAEILRVANSALFGVAREIASIDQALAMLGMERVRTMAMLVALNSMIKPAMRLPALRKFWLHSLVTAFLAEEAARPNRVSGDTAYTAGLLHNLGALGLMSAYPDEYSRMLEVGAEYGFDLLQTERDLFEIDHCAAGAYLAAQWDFPAEILAAAETHHEEPVRGGAALGNLVRIAWRLAEAVGFTAFPSEKVWAYEALVSYIPNLEHSWLAAAPGLVKSEVDSRLASFRV